MDKKILILTATHGDEPLGVNVMKQIEKNLPKNKYGYDWIIANESAYKKCVRFTEVDLNRIAPGNIKSSIYEEKRAAELIRLSRKYNFIIDLHSSKSYCGVTTIITHPTLPNLILASILDADRYIIWYARSSLDNGPITQFTYCPAIEIECGPAAASKVKTRLIGVLTQFITKLKDLTITELLEKSKKIEFYAVYGKQKGRHNLSIVDFRETTINKETFYPFLANQYEGILCYKAKKINIKDLFIY